MYSGYISFRDKYSSLQNRHTTIDLLEKIYNEQKEDFIHYIKGNFILIHLTNDAFRVYSDHFAVRKYFYWHQGTKFIVSSDIREILKHTICQPSPENIARYALTYHFTGGTTLYRNIFHNEPAEIIEFNNNKFEKRFYWQPVQLLNLPKNKRDIREISQSLGTVIDTFLNSIDKSRISLSLTGGADTRNLLALFLNKDIKPHLYTYGNPESTDCLKASAIARGLGLNHAIHNIQMNAKTFEQYARKIIKHSGGIASIHRAHRVVSVELEKQYADWMFLGTLGGEFIKGVSEDDYIVPAIVYDNWENENYTKDQLARRLHAKFISPNYIDMQKLLSFIKNEPYMKGAKAERKLNALSFITAHLHDAQDVNLYKSIMNEVFTPFLDVDYLELVFSSQFSFDQKEKLRNKFLARVNNPIYGAEFINSTYKPLLYFLYSGDHKPSEVLFNKYYAALAKIVRQRTRPQYPPNFPLSKWMADFIGVHLPLCKDYKILDESFHLDGLIAAFKNGNHIPKESYWLKFTNPIMMRFIIEEMQN